MLLKPKSSLASGSGRRASPSPAQFHTCKSTSHPASAVQQPEQAGSTSVSCADTDHTQEQPSTSGRPHGTAAVQQAAAAAGGNLVTFSEMQEIAASRGMHLALKTLGPFYRITCRDGAQGVARLLVCAGCGTAALAGSMGSTRSCA